MTQSSSRIEDVRSSGDPSRFFPSVRSGVVDAVTGRILSAPRCYVACNSALLMPNGLGLVSFDLVERDNDGMWNASVPSRVTISSPGIYDTKMNVQFAAGGAGNHRQAWVRKNNGTGRFAWDQRPVSAVLGRLIASDSITMNAGDYLEIVTEHDNGGNLALAPSAFENYGASLNVYLASTFGSDNQ